MTGPYTSIHGVIRVVAQIACPLHARYACETKRTSRRVKQTLTAFRRQLNPQKCKEPWQSACRATQRVQAQNRDTAGEQSEQSIDERPSSASASTAHRQHTASGEVAGADQREGRENPPGQSSNHTSANDQMIVTQQSRIPNPLVGELSLFIVAACWGTNPVCLRYVYMLQQPPSPSTLAAIQALGGALLLTAFSLVDFKGLWKGLKGAGAGGTPTLGAPEKEPASVWKKVQGQAQKGSVTRAGLEVGLWTFLANAATITAFEQTPASRGAFLIRLTAVFTPIVSYVAGQSPTKREWAACGVALLGGLLISLDSVLESSATNGDASLGVGDAIMILSAFLWAVQTVRLGKHATEHPPATLARNQAATLALCSALWLATDVSLAGSQSPVGSLLAGSGWLIWAAVLWPAIGPWGIGTALQVKAQGTVSPSRTQIILATDPLWATAFAGLLGGAEQHLGGYGWLGAACVIGASVISRH